MGNLHLWADTAEKRAAADSAALLSTDSGVRVKVSRHNASESKPDPDRTDEDNTVTLRLLVSGQMEIVLVREREGVPISHKLSSEGDYLVWRRSAYHKHTWTALEDNTVLVTVRWPEKRSWLSRFSLSAIFRSR